MRLLADQDIYPVTRSGLKTEGHDVIAFHELALQRAEDAVVLRKAEVPDLPRPARVSSTRRLQGSDRP